MKLPRAILFDNDGVLIASEPLHQVAWGQVLQSLGIPFLESDFAPLIGKTSPQMLSILLDKYRPGWKREDYDLDAYALKKNDFYLASLATSLRAYPGVLDGLKWLKSRGVRTAVVSNAKRRELAEAMEITGLGEWLELKLSRDDVPRAKPDPLPYMTGAALLGCDPSECFSVEDSPTGLEAALLAGTRAVAIETNFAAAALAQPVPGRADLKPVKVLPSMQAFFGWLRELD